MGKAAAVGEARKVSANKDEEVEMMEEAVEAATGRDEVKTLAQEKQSWRDKEKANGGGSRARRAKRKRRVIGEGKAKAAGEGEDLRLLQCTKWPGYFKLHIVLNPCAPIRALLCSTPAGKVLLRVSEKLMSLRSRRRPSLENLFVKRAKCKA